MQVLLTLSAVRTETKVRMLVRPGRVRIGAGMGRYGLMCSNQLNGLSGRAGCMRQ